MALYICICLFGFLFGVKFYLLGYTHQYKHFFEALLYEPSETFSNYFDKKSPEDTLQFYISPKNYMILSKDRQRRIGLVLDWIGGGDVMIEKNLYKEEVNCKLYYKRKKMKSKIKIPGFSWDHFLRYRKWSMRVKVRDNNSFKGTKQFNLLRPETREYLIGYIANEIAKIYHIISIEYSPVQVMINGENMGIYLFEDFFNKYLIEKNRKKDSIIFTISPASYSKNDRVDLKILHPSSKKLTNYQKLLISKIENREISFEQIIDEEKLIVLFALGFIFDSWHHFGSSNLHFYYNPHTNLIEPIIREIQSIPKDLTNRNLSEDDIIKRLELLIDNNPYLSNYLNKHLNDNLFISTLYKTIDEIIKVYFDIVSSDEFIKYDSMFNIESIASSWQSNILSNNVKYLSNALPNNDITTQNSSCINDTIIFNGDIIIDKTNTIRENEVLIIHAGSNITFQNNSNLIIYGNIQILGSKKNPVMITNIDDSNSSIVAIKTFGTNNIFHANFENFSSLYYKNWMNTASLTFYESDVIIKNCKFSKNIKGDDYLNIVRADSYLIDNCEFNNILFDAIDIDYSNGKIVNSTFKYIGNDAIDFSGSTADVFNCTFVHCGDKAISCGESSLVNVANSKLSVSKFGIVSKDLSFVEALNNQFNGNEFDFGIYQKKDEFGTGRLEDIRSVGTLTVLMEQNAVLKSDNDKITIIKYDELIHNTQSKSR
tara:strand:- start:247 stop:2382 length:2136 start_codon:yes stop_codon:yes gene_type:complete